MFDSNVQCPSAIIWTEDEQYFARKPQLALVLASYARASSLVVWGGPLGWVWTLGHSRVEDLIIDFHVADCIQSIVQIATHLASSRANLIRIDVQI